MLDLLKIKLLVKSSIFSFANSFLFMKMSLISAKKISIVPFRSIFYSKKIRLECKSIELLNLIIFVCLSRSKGSIIRTDEKHKSNTLDTHLVM